MIFKKFEYDSDVSFRDSEDSAPPEFPPDQPEADEAEDDADTYGAEEEEELEAAEGVEGAETGGEMDVEMGGAEDTAGPIVAATEKEVDEVSDDGSEDLELESSGEEDEEEEGGEGEDDDDAMADDNAKPGEGSGNNPPAVAPQVVA